MKSHLRSDMTVSEKTGLGKIKIKDIVIIALMSSILFAVQVIFAALPNIELVSLLVIVYTLVFGWRTIGIIYVFAVLEGLLYGFGPWWVMYLYIWTILYFIVTLLRKNTSVIIWAAVSGIYGLMFGALGAVVYIFIGGIGMAMAYWIAGLMFDIVHGVSNFFVCIILFKPIYTVLKKLNI